MQTHHFPTPQTFSRSNSARLFEVAKTYFPGGVHSPVRAFKQVQGPPIFFESGSGCHLFDVDGQQFVDFCCSWGPLILGHCPPAVVASVEEAVRLGMSFGAPSPRDLALGELVLRQHRYVEMIRFVSSGTEAVMSAIRLARGASGKSKIVKFDGCYHGHVDSLMVKAGSGLATFGISTSAGIPESFARETLVVPLADLDALERVLDHQGQEIACVIIEPIPANNGLLLQDRAYLLAVRDLCTRHGVLLIFDEVISGFRVGFEGAAGLYAIQPDIITFGKILGGGMPVGAYAASRELMEHVAPMGPVYQAGTLSANPVAMAAGYATLQQLAQPGFYERLEATTAWFTGALESFCEEREYDLRFPHVGSIFWPVFGTSRVLRADQIDPARMQQFKVLHLECLKRGVYWGPSGYEVGFLSAAHDRSALEFALEQIKAAIVVSYDAELTIAH